MSLEGKVALITGAGSGFGEGIAKRFVAGGAKVIVVDRDAVGAERVAKELGDNAIAVVADIAKQTDVEAAVAAGIETFGRVDILINNAGIGHKPQNAELVEPDEFDRILGEQKKSQADAFKAFEEKIKKPPEVRPEDREDHWR